MTRDSQFSKATNAVEIAGAQFPRLTNDEIEATVVKAMNSSWFQKRWDAHRTPVLVKRLNIRVMQTSTYCAPSLNMMTKRANAKRTPHEVEVRLGPSQITLIQVLHAITHLLRPDYNHDAEYCREFLAVVGRFMGPADKKAMTEIFRANKVKIRVYSDEARLAARHRLIARDSIPDLVALRDELAGS